MKDCPRLRIGHLRVFDRRAPGRGAGGGPGWGVVAAERMHEDYVNDVAVDERSARPPTRS